MCGAGCSRGAPFRLCRVGTNRNVVVESGAVVWKVKVFLSRVVVEGRSAVIAIMYIQKKKRGTTSRMRNLGRSCFSDVQEA